MDLACNNTCDAAGGLLVSSRREFIELFVKFLLVELMVLLLPTQHLLVISLKMPTPLQLVQEQKPGKLF
jgi:hypothetical protein